MYEAWIAGQLWLLMLPLLLLAGWVESSCYGNQILQTQRCMSIAYPRIDDVKTSIPGGGQLHFLERFCREQKYYSLTECLRNNITSCESSSVGMASIDASRVQGMWADICGQNLPDIRQHYECYNKYEEGFQSCKNDLRKSVRQLMSKHHQPLSQQNRMDITCRVTSEAVACDHHVIRKNCGSEAADAVWNYANYTNLWACANNLNTVSYPEYSSRTLQVDYRIHEAIFGLTSGSYMFGCIPETLRQLDTCLASKNIHSANHNSHPELFIATGNKHFVGQLCRNEQHAQSCLRTAAAECTDLNNLYDVPKIEKTISHLCAVKQDYDAFSKRCHKHLHPRMRDCRRAVNSNGGDICRDNEKLNFCMMAAIQTGCSDSPVEAVILAVHQARLPKHCHEDPRSTVDAYEHYPDTAESKQEPNSALGLSQSEKTATLMLVLAVY